MLSVCLIELSIHVNKAKCLPEAIGGRLLASTRERIDHPAADAEVKIGRVSDLMLVRRRPAMQDGDDISMSKLAGCLDETFSVAQFSTLYGIRYVGSGSCGLQTGERSADATASNGHCQSACSA
jgi:hypothetical protein